MDGEEHRSIEGTITSLIAAVHLGDPSAREELSEIMAPMLLDVARRRFSCTPPGQTVLPEDVAQEVWIKILGGTLPCSVRDRRTLAMVIATKTRDCFIDLERRKRARRRQGDRRRNALDENTPADLPDVIDHMALGEALDELATATPKAHEAFFLRYYGGLRVEEVAELLGMSTRMVGKYTALAKKFLSIRMKDDIADGS